jgi:hypothetical protein
VVHDGTGAFNGLRLFNRTILRKEIVHCPA